MTDHREQPETDHELLATGHQLMTLLSRKDAKEEIQRNPKAVETLHALRDLLDKISDQ